MPEQKIKSHSNLVSTVEGEYTKLMSDPHLLVNQGLDFRGLMIGAEHLFGSYPLMSSHLGGQPHSSTLNNYAKGHSNPRSLDEQDVIEDEVWSYSHGLVRRLQRSQTEHRGQELEILRRLNGNPTDNVADAVGVHRDTVRKYERNVSLPDDKYERIKRLHMGLDPMPISDFGSTVEERCNLVIALMYNFISALETFSGRENEQSRSWLQSIISKRDFGYLQTLSHAVLDGGDQYQLFALGITQIKLEDTDKTGLKLYVGD